MPSTTLKYLLLGCLSLIALPIAGIFNADPRFLLFKDIQSYAAFHSILVALSFAVCAQIFGVGWYTTHGDRSGLMAFLSSAFLAVGLLDLGHLLSFGGMPAFVTPSGGDKALAFWLTARYAGALPLLALSLAPARTRISLRGKYALFAVVAIYVAAVYGVVLYRPALVPPLYVEGRGLTPLKVGAEYGLVAIHLLTAIVFAVRRTAKPLFPVGPLLAAVIVLSSSEIAFSLYRVGYDNFNVAGHLLKLAAFALIYRAVFVEAVTEPYRLREESEATLRQSREQLRQSQAHLARAQGIGHVGSSEVDLRTGERHWSDEYFRIFGFDPATTKVDAALIRDAVVPEDRDKLVPIAVLAAQEGPIEPIDFRIRRPDGQIRWLHRHAAKMADDNGVVTTLVFTAIDVTEIKRADERQLQLERQLAQAQKMEAVGQLTGGIAHDFNNLLSVILGRLQMLREELSTAPRLREWTEVCIRAAQRGASLTRSLLAFSRMQALKPASIELNAIVADTTELLRRMLGEAVEIRLSMKPDLWPCLADPGEVQTALLNLAINARDAMPNGGQMVIATQNAQIDEQYAASHEDVIPGDYVLLSVSDAGTGMSAEVRARAFEPFFTTKMAGRGSGLGLSMVYGFVKQSGGHVSIYSELGLGTTVKLYLPRASSPATAPTATANAAAIERGHETILVVEDSDDLRDLTQAQLERLGYTVLTAPDSAKGLHCVAQHGEIALIVTDIVLSGGGNGPQLVDSARALRPDLPVVFMTGYSGLTAAESLNHVPAESVLQKPFSIEQLARLVRDAIDRRTSGAAHSS